MQFCDNLTWGQARCEVVVFGRCLTACLSPRDVSHVMHTSNNNTLSYLLVSDLPPRR